MVHTVSRRYKRGRLHLSNAPDALVIRFIEMREFRYVEINERPDGVEAKYKIGDLVKEHIYSDYKSYNWIGFGKIGLIVEIKFFIQESFDIQEHIKYVTEYKVQWIESARYDFLDESMIVKLENE